MTRAQMYAKALGNKFNDWKIVSISADEEGIPMIHISPPHDGPSVILYILRDEEGNGPGHIEYSR